MSQIRVKLHPNAPKNRVSGISEGVWKIGITAPPIEGKANARLINFLSTLLGITKSNICIVKGHTSCNKLVDVQGIQSDEIDRCLLKAIKSTQRS